MASRPFLLVLLPLRKLHRPLLGGIPVADLAWCVTVGVTPSAIAGAASLADAGVVSPADLAGVVTVGVASLADAGAASLADAGVASPADLAGAVTVGVTSLDDAEATVCCSGLLGC